VLLLIRDNLLLVRCWFTGGSWVVRGWFVVVAVGSLATVRGWFEVGSWVVRWWFAGGSLVFPWFFCSFLVHCLFIPNS
jgi:hypothetical protein